MMCFCPLNIPKISLQHIQMVKPTLCFQDDSKLFHSWRIGSRNLKRMMEITKIHNQSALILHIWSLGHKQEMLLVEVLLEKGFPGSTGSEESACQFRRCRFDPWVRKIPWRRKWQPLQYSSLGNPLDRGAWETTVHGVAMSRTRLSTHTYHTHTHTHTHTHCLKSVTRSCSLKFPSKVIYFYF